MAAQIVYACDIPLDASGVCLGNSVEFTVDSDLATALNTHSTALTEHITALEDIFLLNVDDVGLISGLMLATFITGNSIGKVVKLMVRKT